MKVMKVTALTISVLCSILMILSILFFPKVKIGKVNLDTYWIITLISALLLIVLKQIDLNNILSIFFSDDSINPIKIIVLFLSMTLLSIYLDQIGMFKYLANLATKKFNKNQFGLFVALYFLISILTVITSNDVIILTFTPFICYFCKHAGINPLPYLIGEFFAANTLSMSLIIGNPTNIYIASIMNITFMEYFKNMFIIGFILCIALFGILLLIFKKQLSKPLVVTDEEVVIESKTLLIIGVVHLALATILMAISNYINLEMYLISFGFALSLTIITLVYSKVKNYKNNILKNTYKGLPYPFIPFLLSMVVIISSLKYSGVLTIIANKLAEIDSLFLYEMSSFVIGNLVNNIPMSIIYSEILNINSGVITFKEIYAVIISSNICALFTPLGSLAGMMFLGLLKNQNVNFKFKNFLKYSYISIIMLFLSFFLISITM